MISGVDSLMPLTHLAHLPSHNFSSNPLFSIFKSLSCFVPSLFLYYFCFPSLMASVLSLKVLIWVKSYDICLFWWISFSIIPSSSIHVVANGKISFFSIAEWYSIVYINHIVFIHSSTDGHLGSFHTLAIIDSAAINMGVHVSLRNSTPVPHG